MSWSARRDNFAGSGRLRSRIRTAGGATSRPRSGCAQNAIRASLPSLRKSRQASISVLVGPGHQGSLPFAAGYRCAQAALVRLVESLGQELTAETVAIFAVYPGLVPTGIVRGLIDTQEGRRWLPQFNEAFAEGKEVDASIAAEMVGWLIENRPPELNGRVVAAPMTPTILETRLERIRSENLGVLSTSMTGRQPQAKQASCSERLTAGHGVGEHVAVGEFQGAAGGQAASQPGDPDAGVAEAVGDQAARCRRLRGWGWWP